MKLEPDPVDLDQVGCKWSSSITACIKAMKFVRSTEAFTIVALATLASVSIIVTLISSTMFMLTLPTKKMGKYNHDCLF